PPTPSPFPYTTLFRSVHLFKPRDGYRTRVNPNILGPTIEYVLPASTNGPVTIEILDAKGNLINSYNSDAPAATGRGGRDGGAGGDRKSTRLNSSHVSI